MKLNRSVLNLFYLNNLYRPIRLVQWILFYQHVLLLLEFSPWLLLRRLVKLFLVLHCNKITCGFDPFPTRLLMSYLRNIIYVILHIVNLCITTNVFPLPEILQSAIETRSPY